MTDAKRARRPGRKAGARKKAARARAPRRAAPDLPRALVVTGMHRSGTSAVAGVLRLLGVELGDRLMPAQPDNPVGFFEHRDLSELHDQLLEMLGRAWHDVRPLDVALADGRVERLRMAIRNVICRDLSSAPVWAVKDPRLCRLLPLWRQIIGELPCAPGFVLVVRNPIEVAGSLSRRNGFPAAKSLLLWLRHNLEAEYHSRGWPRVIVRYDELLGDWQGCATQISRALELQWPVAPEQAAGEVESLLQAGLRHHAADEKALVEDPRIGGWVRDSYALLCGAAREHDLRAGLDDIRGALEEADRTLAPLLADTQLIEQVVEKKNAELGETQASLQQAQAELAEQADLITSLRTNFSLAEQHVNARDVRLHDLEEAAALQRQVFGQALAAREAEAAALRENLALGGDRVHQRDTQVEDLRNELERRQARLDEEGAAARAREAGAEEYREVVQEHIRSRDVKIQELDTQWGQTRVRLNEANERLGVAEHQLELAREHIDARDERLESMANDLARTRETSLQSQAEAEHLSAMMAENEERLRGESRAEIKRERAVAAEREERLLGESRAEIERERAVAAEREERLLGEGRAEIERVRAVAAEREERLLGESQREIEHTRAVMAEREEQLLGESRAEAEHLRAVLDEREERLLGESCAEAERIRAEMAMCETRLRHESQAELERVRAEATARETQLLRELEVLDEDRRIERADAKHVIDEQAALIDATRAQVIEREEQAIRVHAMALDLEKQVGGILSSHSYRITAPLRAVHRGLLRLGRGLRELPRLPWALTRWTFQGLPGSEAAKYRLKSIVFRHFGFFFRRTNAYLAWHSLQAAIARSGAGEPAAIAYSASSDEPEEGDDECPRRAAVSIVIPVYDQLDLTLACLDSVSAAGSLRPFEVIVVDDASSDATRETLSRRSDIRYLRNKENSGFIASCNRGAEAAEGRLLVFLNNDTRVSPGWLDELAATFDRAPDAGLVGARLVYPDGRLQEAGGLLWRDGSAWNYGRDGDAEDPLYSYAREVDYCSGACIMVPTAIFRGLSGFDDRYAPAYGEDSDLALRIRALGMRVVYQPLARVEHHEGASSGTDENDGIKAHQPINALKLFERWAFHLADHALPGVEPELEKDRRVMGRVLFIDACTPTPDQDAGSLTALGLMEAFQSLAYKVTFVPEDNFLFLEHYTRALQRIGIECLYSPYQRSVEEILSARGSEFDVVVLFRHGVAAKHLAAVRRLAPQARVVFHTSDLHFVREEREAKLLGSVASQASARDTRRRELAVIRDADCTIVHSSIEEEMLAELLPDSFVYTFPWILEVKGRRASFAERRGIAFLGGFGHPPNTDAALYFEREIFPLIRKRLPGVKFYIVGANPPDELYQVAADDVLVTGYVEDLGEYFDRVRVAVAPVRYGAGIKGKVAMSMSYGVPNVATPIAAEGMAVEDGVHLLVADGPHAFADEVVRLYSDEGLWESMSNAGMEYLREGLSVERGRQRVAEILERLERKPFFGLCSVCGSEGHLPRLDCNHCGASLTERRVAAALVRLMARLKAKCLVALAALPDGPRILELGRSGAVTRALVKAEGHHHLDPVEQALPGWRAGPNGSDQEKSLGLPFANASFDIILSGDLLARTHDDEVLQSEIRRCLAPNGTHLFSVPYLASRPHNTVFEGGGAQADTPPPGDAYRAAVPALDSAPVRRCYGRALFQQLEKAGFRVSLDGAPDPALGLPPSAPVWLCQHAGEQARAADHAGDPESDNERAGHSAGIANILPLEAQSGGQR